MHVHVACVGTQHILWNVALSSYRYMCTFKLHVYMLYMYMYIPYKQVYMNEHLPRTQMLWVQVGTFSLKTTALGTWVELALLWESQGLNTSCTPLGYWFTSVFNRRCVSKPSSRQAIAVVLQWLDWRGPAVTTMSHPLAFTSARWNSIARTYRETKHVTAGVCLQLNYMYLHSCVRSWHLHVYMCTCNIYISCFCA